MYTPILVQPCDVVARDELRLTRAQLSEFQIQFAANQGCSDDAETWLDECEANEMMQEFSDETLLDF